MDLTKNRIRHVLDAERKQLLGFVQNMREADLDALTLCDGWRVRDVLAHILAYELYPSEVMKLFRKPSTLDTINNAQGNRYETADKLRFVRDLQRGHRRMKLLMWSVPGVLFTKKFIRIPNGNISPGQLFGDVAGDRAVHFLDIAYPLKNIGEIPSSDTRELIVDFMLDSIALLNRKIPEKYHGKWVGIHITGDGGRSVSWRTGDQQVVSGLRDDTALTITADAHTFIFSIMVRPQLLHDKLSIEGDQELSAFMDQLFSSNTFWA